MTSYSYVRQNTDATPHAIRGAARDGLRGAKTLCGTRPESRWHEIDDLDLEDPPVDLCGFCATHVEGLDPDEVPRTEDA